MRPIKLAIVLCWIMLVACFVIKLFGGNWFDIVCTNEHFSNLCDFIDNNVFIKYIIAFPLYVFGTYFIIVSCCKLPNANSHQKTMIVGCLVMVWLSQFISMGLKMALEIIVFLFMPTLLRYMFCDDGLKSIIKKNWHLGIIGYLLDLGFQLLSLVTRNIGIKLVDDKILVSLILMIDYYIMIALYYLYVKTMKGEKKDGNVRNDFLQRANRST